MCFVLQSAKIKIFSKFAAIMETQELQRIKTKYNITGNDAALNLAIETAAAIAPTDLSVLITGESGVGKDVIPQIIHQASKRKFKPYLAVNCGSIPVGTINAELFGHVKGAFTGAVADRKGYFEEADGGTLFLDEIGELPKDTQAMLLRVLQDGEYMKVGSSKIEKTDVRVIAATNADLAHGVAVGKFREDLFYRLNGIQIKMPALRERREDIYLLFRKFTSDFADRNSMCKLTLSLDAVKMLCSYRWPGNIRQLKNFTEALTALESRPSSGGAERVEIGPGVLKSHMPKEFDTVLPATTVESSGPGGISNEDKRAIVKAILDLKQEVDTLKSIVASGDAGRSVIPAPRVGDGTETDTEDVEWEEAQKPQPPVSLRKAGDEMLERALERHGGNVKLAAAELGISERTIYRKLAERKASK